MPSSCHLRLTPRTPTSSDPRDSSTSPRGGHDTCCRSLSWNTVSCTTTLTWCGSPTHSHSAIPSGDHDVYFMDDMTHVKPLDHSHELLSPGKKGRTYIFSCLIFLPSTKGAKLLLMKWIEEMKEQAWLKQRKSNDQSTFNWALKKTTGQIQVLSIYQKGGLPSHKKKS